MKHYHRYETDLRRSRIVRLQRGVLSLEWHREEGRWHVWTIDESSIYLGVITPQSDGLFRVNEREIDAHENVTKACIRILELGGNHAT